MDNAIKFKADEYLVKKLYLHLDIKLDEEMLKIIPMLELQSKQTSKSFIENCMADPLFIDTFIDNAYYNFDVFNLEGKELCIKKCIGIHVSTSEDKEDDNFKLSSNTKSINTEFLTNEIKNILNEKNKYTCLDLTKKIPVYTAITDIPVYKQFNLKMDNFRIYFSKFNTTWIDFTI